MAESQRFADNLKRAAQQAGVSPKQIALAIGLEWREGYKIVNGQRKCSLEEIAVLAKLLKCSPSELLNGVFV